MRPGGLRTVAITGGEPLLIDGIWELTDRLLDAGLLVFINLSGHSASEERLRRLERISSIHVSVDGPDAATHDRIRGRAGAFTAALRALELLDAASKERTAHGKPPLLFGIDTVLVRSNVDGMERIIDDVAKSFSELRFVNFGAVVPFGLANAEAFADELPTEEQMQRLRDADLGRALGARLGAGRRVTVSDNSYLRMSPADGGEFFTMTVEPDGEVRALPAYAGTVGNLLTTAPETLWQAACRRRNDPFIIEQLRNVRTMAQWASASRAIERFYAAPADLMRIAKRRPASALAAATGA
jgi:MoaA/NifB/PqqE/SkfB family radical SAM enzyme